MSEELENDIYTLVDEDGKECEFRLIGKYEENETIYLALVPMDDNDEGEYVILKVSKDEAGEDVLVTVDDDEEFDRIADIFDDQLFDEVDYDEGENNPD